jgi:catechol 2,3-dioxygenase-like lactoylglutathione lyase family enzyme
MEVNGIAHVFLTASNFERSREFYRKDDIRLELNHVPGKGLLA